MIKEKIFLGLILGPANDFETEEIIDALLKADY